MIASPLFTHLPRMTLQYQGMQTVICIILPMNQQKRITLVSGPDVTSSSIASSVNACSAALSATEFPNLLQTCNIQGHTAIYCA
ncbi:hypothetical protein BDR03DRAFT_413447 [Suillus americanus]|nr:hypothetical protein BDR03DRAFT_413447 [Suillus americanus]